MMTEGRDVPPRIRPGWVWAIFVFYLVSTAWVVLVRVLLSLDMYPAPAKSLAMIRSQSTGSVLFNFVSSAVTMAAATMLWLLRRQAFPLFVTATVLTICGTTWQMFSGDPIDQLMSQSPLMLLSILFGLLIAWVILLAICMYTWSLQQRGVLQ